jgi:hypothetical protein
MMFFNYSLMFVLQHTNIVMQLTCLDRDPPYVVSNPLEGTFSQVEFLATMLDLCRTEAIGTVVMVLV